MTDEQDGQVPEGAAVFPLIPADLGVHPLLLAVLHAMVFVAGSDEAIINPDAADEAVSYMADYLRRLQGIDLARVREDMDSLIAHAAEQQWSGDLIEALEAFLADCGVGDEDQA